MDRRVKAILIPAIVAAAIVGYLVFSIWESIPVALQHFDPALSIVAAACCISGWMVRGERYRCILRGLSIPVSTRFSLASIFASQTANLITPARLGDLVRIYVLKHENVAGYSQGLSSLVVERIFDILSIALLGFISVNFVFEVPGWAYTLLVVPFVAGGVFLLILYALGMLKTDNRYIGAILLIVRQIRDASLEPDAIAILSILSILVWLADIAVCAVVVAMFDEPVAVMVVILAIAIGNLVKAVPLTPGGIGTYEAAVATILLLSGMPYATAALVAFIDHLIKNLVTLAGGLLSIYVFGGWVGAAIRQAVRTRIGEEETGG